MQEYLIDWNAVEKEATEYLSQYLQIDTTNPPGNEIEGARFLKTLLGKEGISCEIMESEPLRASLIGRLPGSGSKRPLLLLSHIDVVPAEADKWAHPPLSGAVIGNEIWGRGAVDCKGLGIAELMVLLVLKRSGQRLKRDVMLVATADEEKGSVNGAAWLCRNRKDLLEVDAIINEGGGAGISRKKNNFYFCQVAEKGISWFRITFSGSPGHASIPREDNCILSLGRCLNAVGNYRSLVQVPPVTRELVNKLSLDPGFAPLLEKIMQHQGEEDEALGQVPDRGVSQLLGGMIRNTFVPTVVKGGEKTNVIPSECYCEIDCRMVPGEKPEQVQAEMESVLNGISDYRIEVLDSSVPSESPLSHPLLSVFEESLRQHDPRAVLVPFVSSGATDSRFFRAAGIPAFGFGPLLAEGDYADYHDLLHGHNERISRKNLLFAIKVLYDVVRQYCG
ncbi:MAG TPA: M20/M25/M40 family metallo-hydrolase [Thermodesulfobacteriota bacterium]|nr:M20/M25/M40 family metallo-hydrolase [Deltaproteobacteria bacterium]HNR13611.1 M20/M25/M40 family metallo-hydrolase [Thermodesulfobacteriota bacterium]HNU71499.1 M20/M25/M40 family metallo-hydrolase [Thermodesulfobacteriota bacterium]HQO77355.1 M20/M25/M40 family metallo-hydrolase [Thermodesulfobacteriota bacterium]